MPVFQPQGGTPYKPSMFEQLQQLGVPQTVMGILQTAESIKSQKKARATADDDRRIKQLELAATVLHRVAQTDDPEKRAASLMATGRMLTDELDALDADVLDELVTAFGQETKREGKQLEMFDSEIRLRQAQAGSIEQQTAWRKSREDIHAALEEATLTQEQAKAKYSEAIIEMDQKLKKQQLERGDWDIRLIKDTFEYAVDFQRLRNENLLSDTALKVSQEWLNYAQAGMLRLEAKLAAEGGQLSFKDGNDLAKLITDTMQYRTEIIDSAVGRGLTEAEALLVQASGNVNAISEKFKMEAGEAAFNAWAEQYALATSAYNAQVNFAKKVAPGRFQAYDLVEVELGVGRDPESVIVRDGQRIPVSGEGLKPDARSKAEAMHQQTETPSLETQQGPSTMSSASSQTSPSASLPPDNYVMQRPEPSASSQPSGQSFSSRVGMQFNHVSGKGQGVAPADAVIGDILSMGIPGVRMNKGDKVELDITAIDPNDARIDVSSLLAGSAPIVTFRLSDGTEVNVVVHKDTVGGVTKYTIPPTSFVSAVR